MLLAEKRAVVTGSSRGLGRAYALALAQAGASVVVNGTSAPDVARVVQEIGEQGGTAVGCVESVATWHGAQRIIQTAVDSFGGIDILVNNAGVLSKSGLLDMTEGEFDNVIGVNLKGAFACGRFAALQMTKQQKGGRIINTTSWAAMRGTPGATGYGASKAGIVSMTLTWAKELGQHNITANAIRTTANTRMLAAEIAKARLAAERSGKPPPSARELGVFEPEEAAPLVVFLASDEAGWITGQVIGIDGPRLCLLGQGIPQATVYMPQGWTVDSLMKHFKESLGAHLQPVRSAMDEIGPRPSSTRQ